MERLSACFVCVSASERPLRRLLITTVVLVATAWPFQAGAAGRQKTLCAVGETKIFSCPVRGKLVSVCRDRTGVSTYRFGRPGRIELQSKNLRVAQIGASGNTEEIFFENNGFQYVVHSGWWKTDPDRRGKRRMEENSGLAVLKRGRVVWRAQCPSIEWIDESAFDTIPGGPFIDFIE